MIPETQDKKKELMTRLINTPQGGQADGNPKPASKPTIDFSRRTTFGRAFTFDRTSTFTRTLSQAMGYDSDVAWTKDMLETYNKAKNKGVQGDVPLPPAFARDAEFWKTLIAAGILGAFLGFAALLYLNIADKVPRIWAYHWQTEGDDDFFSCSSSCSPQTRCVCEKYKNMDFYQGEKYWIIITTCTGLIVGLFRFAISYPDDLPGIFQEIHKYHVEPKWAPWTFMISAISLAGGACLGPEQALGNLGGGLATYLAEHYIEFKDEDNKHLFILSGMASAIGALFPTPLLAPLMIQELGHPPKSYMESTLVMSFGACIGFMVYYAIVDISFIESLSTKGAFMAFDWTFEEWNCLTGFVIGVISAVIGIVTLVMIGACKQILNRIRLRLARNHFLATVLPSVIAGACVGTVNWALPLTLGNGNMVLSAIVGNGYQGNLSAHLLVCSAFAKMFCLGMCMNGGFVGGFVFPIITIGVMAGVVCNIVYPTAPLGLCVGCFMTAIPGGIAPMPFTLSCLTIFCFFFGLYQTAPIFISAIISYTLISGTGLLAAMQKRSKEQQSAFVEEQGKAQGHPAGGSGGGLALAQGVTDQEADSYAVEHYLGAKRAMHAVTSDLPGGSYSPIAHH